MSRNVSVKEADFECSEGKEEHVPLTLEQQVFEVCRSTYTQNFVNKYSWVSHPWIQPSTAFSVSSWESENVAGQVCALLYDLFYKALEHLGIEVSMGGLESIPCEY